MKYHSLVLLLTIFLTSYGQEYPIYQGDTVKIDIDNLDSNYIASEINKRWESYTYQINGNKYIAYKFYSRNGNINRKGLSVEIVKKSGAVHHAFFGKFSVYRRDGTLMFESYFDDYGNREGIHNFYYKNGQLKFLGNYRNNNKHVIWKKFNKNGILIMTIEYEDNKVIKKEKY